MGEYIFSGIEIGCIVGIAVCLIYLIYLTVEDAVDYHYSKKRGEIGGKNVRL